MYYSHKNTITKKLFIKAFFIFFASITLIHSTPSSHSTVTDITKFVRTDTTIKFQNKPVLLIFGATYCIPCATLERDIVTSKALRTALMQYDVYRIDIDITHSYTIDNTLISDTITYHKEKNWHKSPPIYTTLDTKDLSKAFNIYATPTFIFFDSNAKQLFAYTGALQADSLALTLHFLQNLPPHITNSKNQAPLIAKELQSLFAASHQSKPSF